MNESEPTPTSAPTTARPLVPALHKAFAVLDLVARESGIGFTAIRRSLDLPKSSAFQLINTLCDLGALQTAPGGGYVLGLRLCELGAIATSQRVIEPIALPHLQRLARETGMTCHLGVLEGNEAVYLAKVESGQAIKISSWVGKRLSLHRSSLGKALLAFAAEPERERLIGSLEWIAKTPRSIVDAQTLRAELALVRGRGWAVDDEEDVPNIRCVAAPIFDRVGICVAAISAVGTVLQIAPDAFPALAAQVTHTATTISREFSGWA